MDVENENSLFPILIFIMLIIFGLLTYVVYNKSSNNKKDAVDSDLAEERQDKSDINNNTSDNIDIEDLNNIDDDKQYYDIEDTGFSLVNYDISSISSVVLHKFYVNDDDASEYTNTNITDMEIINRILLRIDNAVDNGVMTSVNLDGNDWFEIVYTNNKRDYVYLFDNGEISISKDSSGGKSSYRLYKINNSLIIELKKLIDIYSE